MIAGGTREVLRARAHIEEAARSFFAEEGFLEVTTAAALRFPNLDPHIQPIPVTARDFAGKPETLWLHTSPELSMKKLLARGSGNIFQICQVFRDGEASSHHRPEFSMLEWYRLGEDYSAVIADTMEIMVRACRAVRGTDRVHRKGAKYNLAAPWEEMTMREAFSRYADVESFDHGNLAKAWESWGFEPRAGETTENLFFRIYLEKVEPRLGMERPTIVKEFPAFLGTLARPRPGAPDILERFEAFVGGLELANGYAELTDEKEAFRRMEIVRKALAGQGMTGLCVDGDFLQATAVLPPCSGASVGMDRLAMLLLETSDISQVTFPFEAEPAEYRRSHS